MLRKWLNRLLAEPGDPVLAEIRQTEADCHRRLDYVEAHLARMERKRGPFSAAMTVADVDIMPMGRATTVISAVRSWKDWQWYIAFGTLVLLLVGIAVSIAMCDTGGGG